MGDFSKYVKYVAYAKVFKEFKELVGTLGTERPATSTLSKVMWDAYYKCCRSVTLKELNANDSLDTIAAKKYNNDYVREYRDYSENARTEFLAAFADLNRPSLPTVYKAIDAVLYNVTKDLLEV